MKVARTIAEARSLLAALPRPLGLVPTMGALHDGHLALVRAARERCASVAASLFVNPTQFGPAEDFKRYPRDERRDLELLASAGVDVVFAPTADEMYAPGFATTVHVGGPLTETLEGAARASHFDGVAVIVSKLFTIVAPDIAFFGQKDAQQLAVIRRFTTDLDLPVEIAAVPTVREPDGLAMSSRNVYLDAKRRALAPRLFAALLAGRAAARGGHAPGEIVRVVTSALNGEDGDPSLDGAPVSLRSQAPGFLLDYCAVVDADTFAPEPHITPRSLIVVAAQLGGTRLIDNLLALAPRNGDGSQTNGSQTGAGRIGGQEQSTTQERATGPLPGANAKKG